MSAELSQLSRTPGRPRSPLSARSAPRGRISRRPVSDKQRSNIMSNGQKVVVITGASQGIGAALVSAYLDRNYRVVATSRSIQPSNNPDILTIAGDIGDPATGPRVIAAALEKFGRIDTLVNNAGIF